MIPHFHKTVFLLMLVFYASTAVEASNVQASPYSTRAMNDSIEIYLELIKENQYKEPRLSLEFAYRAIVLSKKTNDEQAQAELYSALGDVYFEMAIYYKALEAYSDALSQCSNAEESLFTGQCLSNMGKTYCKMGIYSLALKNFRLAASLYNEEGHLQELSLAYTHIGHAYACMKEHDQAMQYFNDVLDLPEDQLPDDTRARTYSYIGDVFSARGNLPLSQDFYRRSLRIFSSLGDTVSQADIELKLGDNKLQEADHDAALRHYGSAAEMLEKGHFYHDLARAYISMAKIYSLENEQENAVFYTNAAISIAREHELREILAECYRLLSELYARSNEMHTAYNYMIQYDEVRQSILDLDLANIIARAETRNAFLEYQIDIDKIDQEREFQTYTRWSFILILLLSLITIILAFSRIRSQRRANRLLEHQRNIMKDTLLELRTSEEKYKVLFSQANDAIFLMNRDHFVDCNDKTLEMFNCKREEIIGHSPYDFSPEIQPDGTKSKEKALKLIRKCQDGKPQRFYWVHTRPDGSTFDAEVSLNNVILGEKEYIQAIVRDISDRVKAENEMLQARDRAEHATESKTYFLARMSHEIRTMLGGITSSAELLRGTDVDENQSELLDIINISADSLLEIVNEILDLTKIEAGKIEIEERPFDLHKTLENCINTYAQKARGKNIDIFLSIHPRVPENIAGDELRLKQILTNLLSNAVKFTDKGNVTLEAVVVKENEEDFLLDFSVTDTGIGIPENKIKDLFSEYSQSDSSISRKYGGSGLGLNIVYRLVELMDGSIDVSSTLEEGTCFRISLALKKTDEKPVQKERKRSKAGVQGKNYSILLAEDNVLNQKITMINLMNLGHEVDLAENGIEAWNKYNEKEYDVILMDIQMPEMDGIQVTHMIRKYEASHPEKKRTRIVALTANILGQDANYCLSEGMDAYIAKPFKVEDIIDKISENNSGDEKPKT